MRRRLLTCLVPVSTLVLAGCTPDGEGHVGAATVTTVTTVPATSTTITSTTSTAVTTTSSTSTSTTVVATTTSSVPPEATSPIPTVDEQPMAPCDDSPSWVVRPPVDRAAPEPSTDWTTEIVGRSAHGRDIVALRRGTGADPVHRVFVIGAIHGNEPYAPVVVRELVTVTPPPGVELWLIPEPNPDGSGAGRRCNANGVDLNRNFPWRWSASDGGQGPASEPETAVIVSLLGWLRPDVVVWVHQPLGYVSSVGSTDDRFEQVWSAASGVGIRPDVTQHGGGESWAAMDAGLASLLVEVDDWEVTDADVAAHRAGFEAVLQLFADTAPPPEVPAVEVPVTDARPPEVPVGEVPVGDAPVGDVPPISVP